MPTQLDELWASSTWPQRYILSSSDVNNTLLGMPVARSGKHWTKQDVARFVRWMDANCTVLAAPVVLYRGSQSPDVGERNKAFLSTSLSRKVALEFAKASGFVHVVHCQPGCRVFDMGPHYAGNRVLLGASREREVLVMPGTLLTPLRKHGRSFHWTATKM